jgi:uncharacterized membrane protein
MAQLHVIAGAGESPEFPTVRQISPTDLQDVLARGFDDFWAMPSQILFIALIYPVAGIVLAGLMFGYNVLPLLYPLASGFALVGPLAAIGLYELSRRREQELPTEWKHAFEVLRSPAMASIAMLGVVLFVIFIAWLMTAQALYTWLYGYAAPASLTGFVYEVLTTSRGWTLILLGNLIGFLYAAVVLAISAVLKNPGPMALWGLIVATLLLLGSLPAFIGLAIVMPVLGHSTWHLYRRLVE